MNERAMHEYEKKQTAIMLIAETLNPIPIREVAKLLLILADEKQAEQDER